MSHARFQVVGAPLLFTIGTALNGAQIPILYLPQQLYLAQDCLPDKEICLNGNLQKVGNADESM